MRNNLFLERKLLLIWHKYFSDVPKHNIVKIQFGRKAKKRLGSIREKSDENSQKLFGTNILINGYFKSIQIPEFVIDATIAHELCHYAQGFASPLPQLSPFPHRGGQVDQEMDRRGLFCLLNKEQSWLNNNWINFISSNT